MEDYQAVKRRFITSWGEMGPCWGINRTMAQIHALLMVSERAVTTDEIMAELKISRGNANMNLRDLISWGLVRREVIIGDRKDYFVSEGDVWKMFCTIVRERKKREIEPIINALETCLGAMGRQKQGSPAEKLLKNKMDELLDFVRTADGVMEKISRQDKNKFLPVLAKLLK